MQSPPREREWLVNRFVCKLLLDSNDMEVRVCLAPGFSLSIFAVVRLGL